MSQSAMRPVGLRCEYMHEPLGIDAYRPRLSWRLESSERGQVQSAYRVLVASSPDFPGPADIWDSGRVEGSRSSSVELPTLPGSGQRCFWKVQVWDSQGCVAESECTWFEMGLLGGGDWEASWVGIDTAVRSGPTDLEGSTWVWPGGQGVRHGFLRRNFELPTAEAQGRADRALFLLSADSWYGLYVNGSEVARGAYMPTAHHIDIADYLVPGVNTLALEVRCESAQGGLIGRLEVGSLVVDTDSSWLATTQEEVGWKAPSHDVSGWSGASELGAYGCKPWGRSLKVTGPTQPCPYLRREFAVQGSVSRARVYATAKGVYELHLNGAKVGEDVLSPGWTDYTKRVQYQTYDVTTQLRQGMNCLGAILGDGWYAGNLSLIGRHLYGPYPLGLLAQVHIEYADGTTQIVLTDGDWRGGTGAIVASDMQHGEAYDAQLEPTGWDEVGFDGDRRGWSPVAVVAAPGGRVVAEVGPPVKVMRALLPVSLAQPSPGVFIFDMGQNMVGWARLRVEGEAGRLVRLRFGEMLNDDGTLYTANLRNAQQTDTYRLKGEGEEVFEPRFTFHGFRYVEVTGYPGVPSFGTIRGMVVHSAAPEVARFECGNPLVNQLVSNIMWGQRGNFVSIPTDCPQRDERMGWTGDAQVFARTACLNMDVAGFYTKWMRDVADAQRPDGQFTDVVPFVPIVGAGNAAWGDAGVIIPWTVYLAYGDTRIIEEHFEGMVRWVEWLQSTTKGLLRPDGGFGDWLSIDADTPKPLVSTAFFAYSTSLVARMAAVIGRTGDAHRFEALFDAIREAFCKEYVREDGSIRGDTQTGYLLALHMNLLPEELRVAAADHLIERVSSRAWHLSTGFVGVGYLNPVLSEAGYDDVAYRLLTQDTYPSWGYSIMNGATTMWERWNSYTKESGFGDVGMNSFNHYSFGSIGEWLYRFAAGIDMNPGTCGYETIRIQPRLSSDLEWVRARYDSIRGPIGVEWHLGEERVTLEVDIPANTTAEVHLPLGPGGLVSEGGRDASESEGLQFLGLRGECAVFRVGSGCYSFESR